MSIANQESIGKLNRIMIQKTILIVNELDPAASEKFW